MLALALGVAVLNHFLLRVTWGCRHDGQSAMCLPVVGCGLFVLAPVSLVLLVGRVPAGPSRTAALLLGLSVFVHFAVQILLMLREGRRGRTKR